MHNVAFIICSKLSELETKDIVTGESDGGKLSNFVDVIKELGNGTIGVFWIGLLFIISIAGGIAAVKLIFGSTGQGVSEAKSQLFRVVVGGILAFAALSGGLVAILMGIGAGLFG